MTNATAIAHDELRRYEAFVAEMAAKADGTVILNSTLEHAQIIIAQIFKTSRDDVKILSGKLDERAYGTDRVCTAAVDFLRRNDSATIKILTEELVPLSNTFLQAIRSAADGARVTVARVDPSAAPAFHFTVGDSRHFRLEAEKEKCEAFVKFGGDKHGRQISDRFDYISLTFQPAL